MFFNNLWKPTKQLSVLFIIYKSGQKNRKMKLFVVILMDQAKKLGGKFMHKYSVIETKRNLRP